MTQALYMRRAALTVGTTALKFEQNDGLRFAFRVHKNVFSAEPNHATIEIYNLNQVNRADIASALDPNFLGFQSPGFAPVTLDAGYSGVAGQLGSSGAIFKGHVQSAVNSRQGADWVTKIIAADGLLSNEVTMSQTFQKGLDIGTVVNAAIAAIKGQVTNIDTSQLQTRVAQGDFKAAFGQLFKGFAFSGRVKDQLDHLFRPLGFELNEDNGQLILLQIDETINAQQGAIELGPDSGLVGTIDPIKDDKMPGAYIIKANSLLRHDIQLGSGVVIKSAVTRGLFKVRKLEHHGDTHGPEWITTFEATQVRA